MKPTKFSPFQNVSLNKIRAKNYVDLIPLRIHRKPTKKFRVQSQVKVINGPTPIKAKSVNENREVAKNTTYPLVKKIQTSKLNQK